MSNSLQAVHDLAVSTPDVVLNQSVLLPDLHSPDLREAEQWTTTGRARGTASAHALLPAAQADDARFRKPTHPTDMRHTRRVWPTPVRPVLTPVDSDRRLFVPTVFPR